MPGPEKVTVRHPRPGRLGREEQPRDLCEGRPRHRLQERQDPPRHAGVRGREGPGPGPGANFVKSGMSSAARSEVYCIFTTSLMVVTTVQTQFYASYSDLTFRLISELWTLRRSCPRCPPNRRRARVPEYSTCWPWCVLDVAGGAPPASYPVPPPGGPGPVSMQSAQSTSQDHRSQKKELPTVHSYLK